MDDDELVDAVLAGQRRALARLLTRVEDGAAARLRGIIARLHPHTGGARIVGITGAPGVGKSTLTSALIGEWRSRGQRVAVLAVDPSSPFSGGALLGDRVRMQDHVLDDGVFVRSMASRGQLGGLSWATPHALLVLDAAGFDVIAVETVGVGQAEIEIAALADTTVVAVAPGMGDSIQAAKAGLLETADVFCVNKADRDGAHRTARELRGMLELGHGDWIPPICQTVATAGEGISALADAIATHYDWLISDDRLAGVRIERAKFVVRELALATIRRRFARLEDAGAVATVSQLAGRVAQRELDPYAAADQLLAAIQDGVTAS